jgi:hypothetical protein
MLLHANQATLRGRLAALALMVDACAITRNGTPVTNPETGVVTYNPTAVYTGQCRVSLKVKNARPDTAGEAQLWLIRTEIQLPMTVTGVQIDDLVRVTASMLDPDLVNRLFYVRELSDATHITARRIQCVEVTG